MSQDSISIFQNPVDSLRVPAQEITTEKVTSLLDFGESFFAFWNLIHPMYLAFVCVSYYIIVTRVQGLKTNTVGRRNLLIFLLTLAWGAFGYFFLGATWLSLLVTGLGVNAAYEFIFKSIFRALERFGWVPLPGWYVEEVKEEKQKNIKRVENLRKPDQ